MQHRHDTKTYETSDCHADLTELRLSIILAMVSHILIAGLFLTIYFVYWNSEDQKWVSIFTLQFVTCVCYPLVDFLVSPGVRFFIKDVTDSLKGEYVPSNVVLVT